MEATARLDHALFQLTPTRTRFDLVVFLRGNSEKLASGLFEPFISHLKFARDEISKGGYSITLRPPNHDAFWFTKATFQRFVRFVSTPAVLERFVTLEREILQIEGSIHANESANEQLEWPGSADTNTKASTDLIKRNSEFAGNKNAVQEENSKIQLQRLLETRKALLRKEQAMAYARGLVAGFEIQNIDDLISFADAYGASRLREACVNFKELCRKKHADRLWMEELAAMEACSPSEFMFQGASGIVLTNENGATNPNALLNISKVDESNGNDSLEASHANSDSKKDDNKSPQKVQVPIAWPNQLPPYMYGFQGPMQQLPPYQGYPFPPMQPMPPPYVANMQWPAKPKSTSGKREKYRYGKGSEDSGEEGETESSKSESDSNLNQDDEPPREHTHRKKNKKKSSRTVVIRNINYITPKRRNGENDVSSSDEDEFIDEDHLREKVNDAVGILKKSRKSSHHKYRGANSKNLDVERDFGIKSITDEPKGGKDNENWDAFQNLLMRDEEEVNQRVDVGDECYIVENLKGGMSTEKVTKALISEAETFIVSSREENCGRNGVKFDDFENGENLRPLVKRMDCADAELVFSRRPERSYGEDGVIVPICADESRVAKSARGEDWFVVNHSGESEYQKPTSELSIFDGDSILAAGDHLTPEKQRKDVIVDDSFMVQPRLVTDNDMYDWKTDISIVADLTSAASPGNNATDASHEKHMLYEPDDLYMVLGRESESAKGSWSLDYGIDASFEEASNNVGSAESKCKENKKLSENGEAAVVKSNGASGGRTPKKDGVSKVAHGSYGRSKSELVPKSRKPPLVSRPIVQKSKFEKEEEMRKKMEELVIQRQKRIAERTAASGLAPTSSKKASIQNKTAKPRTPTRETNRISSVKIRAT